MIDALVNGAPGAAVSLEDRGLQFGDGVFETVAVQDGEPLRLEAHLERLAAGCRRLFIPAPGRQALRAEARRLCRERVRAVLKIIVTRGGGGRGYAPAEDAVATRALILHDWPDYPAAYARDGVDTYICRQRLAHNPGLAGVKHLNRLEQVLLRREIAAAHYPEGLALDPLGNVIEGSHANLFMVKDKALVTPDLSRCGVAGVTRAAILDLSAAAGEKTSVRDLRPEELFEADEVFYCNSLIGVWPVRSINDKKTGHGGAVTRRLIEKLANDNYIPALA